MLKENLATGLGIFLHPVTSFKQAEQVSAVIEKFRLERTSRAQFLCGCTSVSRGQYRAGFLCHRGMPLKHIQLLTPMDSHVLPAKLLPIQSVPSLYCCIGVFHWGCKICFWTMLSLCQPIRSDCHHPLNISPVLQSFTEVLAPLHPSTCAEFAIIHRFNDFSAY